MEKTTIRDMLKENEISVPDYQRAYSWENEHRETLLEDLDKHIQSEQKNEFYFGHFLFEERGTNEFYVIDGQQRLTSIVILVSVILEILEKDKQQQLNECQKEIKNNVITHFNTVQYDNEFFHKVVIEHKLRTESKYDSQKQIGNAYRYLKKTLKRKTTEYLTSLLSTIMESCCTKHKIKNVSEAIQIFIFQNSRGKQATKLEKLKAQFMYYVHLKDGENKKTIINTINNSFESIYKNISRIKKKVSEDEILHFTNQLYFKNLQISEQDASLEIDKILHEKLKKSDEFYLSPVKFVEKYVQKLESCFNNTRKFIEVEGREKHSFVFHSLFSICRSSNNNRNIVFPFILKALKYGVDEEPLKSLSSLLESLIFRDRVIGTKAKLIERFSNTYQRFNSAQDISEVIKEIGELKDCEDNRRWYWINDALRESLNRDNLSNDVAKFILWKYENVLNNPVRFEKVINLEIEHIAPEKEPERPHGYQNYDKRSKFTYFYRYTLGNFILISRTLNSSISNKPFSQKIEKYDENEQQREMQKNWKKEGKPLWNGDAIQNRTEKIVDAIMKIYK